jgi:DivIVA domain-containing protein
VLLTIVEVLAALVVLFAIASYATRDKAILRETPADEPDLDLPIGPIQPEDISALRFSMVLRGYRMSEVDEVLARLGRDLAARDQRILALEQALVDVVEPQVAAAEAAASAAAPTDEPAPALLDEPEAPAGPTHPELSERDRALARPASDNSPVETETAQSEDVTGPADDEPALLVEPVLEEPVAAPLDPHAALPDEPAPAPTPDLSGSPAAAATVGPDTTAPAPAQPVTSSELSEAERALAHSRSDNSGPHAAAGVEPDEAEGRTAGVDPAPDPAPAPGLGSTAVDDLPRSVTHAHASPTALPDLSAAPAAPGTAGPDSSGNVEQHWPQPASEPEPEPLVQAELDASDQSDEPVELAPDEQPIEPIEPVAELTATDDAAFDAFPEVNPPVDEDR